MQQGDLFFCSPLSVHSDAFLYVIKEWLYIPKEVPEMRTVAKALHMSHPANPILVLGLSPMLFKSPYVYPDLYQAVAKLTLNGNSLLKL